MMNVKKLHPRYDDVDLARRSSREGCVEVENGEKGKKRRVTVVIGGSRRGKRGLLGISGGSRGQAPVFFLFSNTHTKSFLFLGFSAPGTGLTFLFPTLNSQGFVSVLMF